MTSVPDVLRLPRPVEVSQDLLGALSSLQIGKFLDPENGHRSLDQAASQMTSSSPPTVFKASCTKLSSAVEVPDGAFMEPGQTASSSQ
jgi:hypothetical protein